MNPLKEDKITPTAETPRQARRTKAHVKRVQRQQQQVSMDKVTAMTTEKEMMDHVKVVMPLFHSTKAQLALKHWPTALKQ